MRYGSAPSSTTIATFVVNSQDPGRSTWDLTPYQSAGIGRPGGTWRIVEAGYNLQYAEGTIADDGSLTGLPAYFESHYSYDGYMELQISYPQDECKSCPCPELEEEECKCRNA